MIFSNTCGFCTSMICSTTHFGILGRIDPLACSVLVCEISTISSTMHSDWWLCCVLSKSISLIIFSVSSSVPSSSVGFSPTFFITCGEKSGGICSQTAWSSFNCAISTARLPLSTTANESMFTFLSIFYSNWLVVTAVGGNRHICRKVCCHDGVMRRVTSPSGALFGPPTAFPRTGPSEPGCHCQDLLG